MRGSPRSDIFKRGKKVDLPAPERERLADQLAALGLLTVERYDVVLCVNPQDHDQKYLKDRSCAGRIRLRPDFDEDDNAYQCPDCGRVIYPRKKRSRRMMRTTPDVDAMRALVHRLVEAIGVSVRETPVGLFRLEGPNGEVQVALADACKDRAVFAPGYPQRESLVFVVGNEREIGRWTKNGARSFLLVDLALGDAKSALQRELRRLLRLDAVTAEAAVFELGGMPPLVDDAPKPTATDPFPGVTRILAPSGTRWNQVELYPVDGETLGVRVLGAARGHHTHVHLGMADKRTKKATKKWSILIALCEAHGRLAWSGSGREWNAHKNQISDLRRLLQHIFGIDADPFELSRQDGLRAAFLARPDAPGSETYVGDVWDGGRQI